jgi:membrane fusion protein (multidrug efflux system)
MKKKLLLVYLLVVLTLLFTACNADEASDEVEEKKVPITVVTVEENDLNETFLSLGRIEAKTSVTVQTGGMGTVKTIDVKAGDQVAKNQVLFTLDQGDLQENYKITESQLRTVRDNLKRQMDNMEEKIRQNQVLYDNQGISKNVLDQSIESLEQVKNQYNDAVVNYNTRIKNLREDLESRKVKSPIEGRVAAVFIEEDESVQNQRAVEIINDDDVIAITDVTANQINQLEIDGPVIVYPDGKSASECVGTIVRFNEIPEDSRGLYEVEVLICNEDGNLRTGQYIEAYYIVDQRRALLVPKSAIKKAGEDSVVYVIEDNIAKEKIVQLGITQDESVEIVSGLEGGDVIALRGSSYLKDGDQIKIIE